MGKGNGSELKEYRSEITRILINDSEICSLLLGKTIIEPDEQDQNDIRNKRIFSYAYIPGVQEEAKRYVTFDIKCQKKAKQETSKDVSLYFYILAHNSLMRDTRTNYLATDLLDERVQQLFNDNKDNDLGLGGMFCIKDDPMRYNDTHYGRMLTFVTQEVGKNMCGV